MVTGHVKTGPITHDLTAGGVLFLRSVQQPGSSPSQIPTLDGVVQDGASTPTSAQRISISPIAPSILPPSRVPHQSAGPRALWEDNHQAAAVMQDRIHLPGRIQLLAGGRFDSLRDHNYSLAAAPIPIRRCATFTDKNVWLPQYAVTFNPVDSLTLYGNYGVLLVARPAGAVVGR